MWPQLSLLSGPLTDDCPQLVLVELAASLGVACDVKELDRFGYKAEIVYYLERRCQPQTRNWKQLPTERLLTFLNPDPELEWSYAGLELALANLERLDSLQPQERLREAIEHGGLPTPHEPQRVPTAMLYRSLKELGYLLHPQMDLAHLRELARLALLPASERAAELELRLARVAPEELLRGQLLLIDQQKTSSSSSDAQLKKVELLQPHTDAQAVALGAKFYRLDLSRCRQPLLEFYRRRRGLPFADDYCRQVQQLNPSAYDLACSWHPELTEAAFTPHLSSVLQHYGVRDQEQLLDLHLLSNFHRGAVHGLRNFRTITNAEDMVELTDDTLRPALVSFGSHGAGFQLHLVSELSWGFEATMEFVNPEGGFFEVAQIERLKMLAHTGGRRHRHQSADWQGLLAAIRKVELHHASQDRYQLELKRAWSELEPSQRETLASYLELLLETAFKMRGWKVGLPLPLEVVPVSDPAEVSLEVSQCLVRLEAMEKASPALINKVLELPLVEYKSGKYCPARSELEGLTLGDRLAIVRQGENTRNINSCVRVTSNWLLASCHRYLTALQRAPNFEVAKIRTIF